MEHILSQLSLQHPATAVTIQHKSTQMMTVG